MDYIKNLGNGAAAFAFTKMGGYLVAAPEEIFVLQSPNLLSERDPNKVTWSVWPSGDHGVAPPGGNPSIGEEPHVMPL